MNIEEFSQVYFLSPTSFDNPRPCDDATYFAYKMKSYWFYEFFELFVFVFIVVVYKDGYLYVLMFLS
jgi:hypothetical protein